MAAAEAAAVAAAAAAAAAAVVGRQAWLQTDSRFWNRWRPSSKWVVAALGLSKKRASRAEIRRESPRVGHVEHVELSKKLLLFFIGWWIG